MPPSSVPIAPGQSGRSDELHENKCRRCGVSCHVAVPLLGRTIVVPGLHCQFLQQQPDGKFDCSVYADRFTRAPWCHHADLAAPLGYLADDCPYGVQPGLGKTLLPQAQFDRVWPRLLRTLLQWGVPSLVAQAPLLAELQRREGGSWALEPWPGDPERFKIVKSL